MKSKGLQPFTNILLIFPGSQSEKKTPDMSTYNVSCLKRVRLERAPGYKEQISLYEKHLTTLLQFGYNSLDQKMLFPFSNRLIGPVVLKLRSTPQCSFACNITFSQWMRVCLHLTSLSMSCQRLNIIISIVTATFMDRLGSTHPVCQSHRHHRHTVI